MFQLPEPGLRTGLRWASISPFLTGWTGLEVALSSPELAVAPLFLFSPALSGELFLMADLVPRLYLYCVNFIVLPTRKLLNPSFSSSVGHLQLTFIPYVAGFYFSDS